MNRPTLYDKETYQAVAKRFVAPLREWFGEDAEDWSDAELETDLTKAFDAAFDWEAVSIFRYFDQRLCYFVDSKLFHLFEAASDETQKRVRAWVISEGILPAFAVGDQVSMPNVDGTIIRVDAETAEYVVQCPTLGHSGAAGYVVGFEKVVGR